MVVERNFYVNFPSSAVSCCFWWGLFVVLFSISFCKKIHAIPCVTFNNVFSSFFLLLCHFLRLLLFFLLVCLLYCLQLARADGMTEGVRLPKGGWTCLAFCFPFALFFTACVRPFFF